ncbi:MAG: hypothetical protein GWN79_06645 [Actinobacteria bacterium]|nr:hypothetical protein [Actinomycetota bacterium]NIS30512.1 hypothetical protein [Actinomycetota bacterium]NIT95107.1 hypothetical protein [Actinomycetota bacterium]NIU18784.1 hypothetical protein [Actinomycetota bacterium]NIU65733.1 hypothetical protein [Actinomycetota bacterium]
MNDREFDQCRTRLSDNLEELVALLRENSEHDWADQLQLLGRGVAEPDALSLDRLMNAYNAAGSLNDLELTPARGHNIRDTDVGFVNQQLTRLRTLVWNDAKAMRRELRHR